MSGTEPEGDSHDFRVRWIDPFLPGKNSKFRRYHVWALNAQSTLSVRTDNSKLFPCALPYPDALAGGSRLDGISKRWWAKRWVNALFSWNNYIVLGCPESEGGYEPQAGYHVGRNVRRCADRLLGEIMAFSSEELISFSHVVEGKRTDVEMALDLVEDNDLGYVQPPGNFPNFKKTNTLSVVADRVAIPDSAGLVDPIQHLPPERAAVLKDLHQLKLPEEQWAEVPVVSHQVAASEESKLVRRLLKANMIDIIPEADLPRTKKGKILMGGLFGVPKNEAEDRLIFDRRPENSTMDRLQWSSLPSGVCFTRMLLEKNQYVRGSGEDLRNFYYMLKLPENFVKHNVVGRRIPREVLQEHGFNPMIPHRMCFKVLGMGDTNACDIAQAVHEHILQKAGVLSPKHILQYGRAPPQKTRWEGVYLDDLLVAQICRTPDGRAVDADFKPPAIHSDDEDYQAIQAAREAYLQAGLKRAEHKAFTGDCNFRAWGAEVSGVRGLVAAPLRLRRDLWKLIASLLRGGYATKELLQRILGYCCFCLQYRRELFALLHRSFSYVSQLESNQWRRLPADIADELRSVALHLPVARWNMRRTISSVLTATDATPSSGGATEVRIPDKLAKELFRRSEYRGAPVRLDGTVPLGSKLDSIEEAKCTEEINELGRSLPWKVKSSYSFRHSSHVNLQELRALKREVLMKTADGKQHGQVHLFFTDSKVCLGCLGKGRSSSYKLNGILRSMVPFLVASDISLGVNYTNTKSNPADYPSRFTSLPSPEPLPGWVRKYKLRSGCAPGWELFAGSARLTEAHRSLGWKMHDPVDILWGKDIFDKNIDRAICAGEVGWLWMAPPCCSFSPLRNLDRGGPLRPSGCPEGDERIPEVRIGNSLWGRALSLAKLSNECGIPFTIEHPRNSRAWKLKETQKLMSAAGVRCVSVDWCQYRGYGDAPNKKATRLLTTCPWVSNNWCLTCGGGHDHGKPLRGARAHAAAAYPKKFCREVALQGIRWGAC